MNNRNEVIHLRVTEQEKAKMERSAAEEGLSLSAFLRLMYRAYEQRKRDIKREEF